MIVYPPIALFVYNRPEHFKRTLEALAKNYLAENHDLVVFSDAPKNAAAEAGVTAVRQALKNISGFKHVEIIERPENFGLAKSITEGVTALLKQSEQIIVLEDDLITSPGFLEFIRTGLRVYEHEDLVSCISGYSPYPQIPNIPETYFLPGADCWGWGTWARAWKHLEKDGKLLIKKIRERNIIAAFDFNRTHHHFKMLCDSVSGKNQSWDILWYASCYLRGMHYLCPRLSLVQNIGMDGSGIHSTSESARWNPGPIAERIHIEKVPVQLNECAYLNAQKFFASVNSQNFFHRINSLLVRWQLELNL